MAAVIEYIHSLQIKSEMKRLGKLLAIIYAIGILQLAITANKIETQYSRPRL